MAKKRFYWSSVFDCVLQEQNEAGQTQVTYTHEPSLYGPLVSENRGGQERQYHFDAHDSTRALTNDTQTVTDTFSYDVWGNEETHAGSTQTPYRWAAEWGYRRVSHVDTTYIRARTYRPTISRWISRDPAEYLDGLNVYVHVLNSPALLTDPSGLQGIVISYVSHTDPKCPSTGGSVTWRFKLDANAPCNGFIVQKVHVHCSIWNCAFSGSPQIVSYDYWEAWRVQDRSRNSSQRRGLDTASFKFANCEVADYSQETRIRFYCNAELGIPARETSNSIPGWDPAGGAAVYYPDANSPCRTTAGSGLTSTKERPSWWPDDDNTFTSNMARRFFLLDWHCCPEKSPCCGDGVEDPWIEYWPKERTPE